MLLLFECLRHPRNRSVVLGRHWPRDLGRTASTPRKRLREFGADLSPMPFSSARELVGFQRRIIGAHDESTGCPAMAESAV